MCPRREVGKGGPPPTVRRRAGEAPRHRRTGPLLRSPAGYPRPWLRGDAIAGLTVWAVLVPESLAYASITGVSPVVGLYANRELLGLGAANIRSGLCSGMVVNGSLSKTAVNGSAGARTQLSGLVTAVITVLTLLFLTSLFEDLPEVAMAAVVIAAVTAWHRAGARHAPRGRARRGRRARAAPHGGRGGRRALELTGAARPAVRLPTDQVNGGSAQHGVDVHTVGQRDQALGDEAAHDDTPPRLVGHE